MRRIRTVNVTRPAVSARHDGLAYTLWLPPEGARAGVVILHRRNDLAKLGLRAMLAGTMANLMSASIVSMLLPR